MGDYLMWSFYNAAICCKLYISIRGIRSNPISDQFKTKGKSGTPVCSKFPNFYLIGKCTPISLVNVGTMNVQSGLGQRYLALKGKEMERNPQCCHVLMKDRDREARPMRQQRFFLFSNQANQTNATKCDKINTIYCILSDIFFIFMLIVVFK